MDYLEVKHEIKIDESVIKKIQKLRENLTELKTAIGSIIDDIIIIEDIIYPDEAKLRSNIIMNTTLGYYNITLKQLQSKSRIGKIVRARQVISVLMKKYIKKLSLSEIGTFVNKDHSTVLHSIKAIKNAEFTKDFLYDEYCQIEKIVLSKIEEKGENNMLDNGKNFINSINLY